MKTLKLEQELQIVEWLRRSRAEVLLLNRKQIVDAIKADLGIDLGPESVTRIAKAAGVELKRTRPRTTRFNSSTHDKLTHLARILRQTLTELGSLQDDDNRILTAIVGRERFENGMPAAKKTGGDE